MHPSLINFSIFSWNSILGSEEAAIKFAVEVGLIPSKEKSKSVQCPKCSSKMSAHVDKYKKLGWRWVCRTKISGKKCCGTVNPLLNTIFYRSKIPFRDVLAIFFCFVLKIPISFTLAHITSWRKTREETSMSSETVSDYYHFCREICDIFASHNSHLLGGKGKTILLDEAFLTRRKYERGRVPGGLMIGVLGIYCREDKEGLFFDVDGKGKTNLMPYVKHHCHKETSILCMGSAKQCDSISKLSNKAVSNTNKTNDLKNRNKLLKKTVKNTISESSLQSMSVSYYRRIRLNPLESDGDRISAFLEDAKSVYPGIGESGLQLKCLCEPNAESEGMEHFLPTPANVYSSSDLETGSEESNSDDSKWKDFL